MEGGSSRGREHSGFVHVCGNIKLFQRFVFPFYQYGGYVCKFLWFLYVRVL